jgi:ATP-binding cassette subfamily B protein
MAETSDGLVADFRRAFGLVWATRPALSLALAALTVAAGLLPTAMVWTGKLIVDAVVAQQAGEALRALVVEAGLAVGLAAVSGVAGLLQGLLRTELGHHVNRRILDKVLTLDLAHFEDPAVYDQLTRARREASVRPLSMVRRVFSVVQQGLALAGSAGLLLGFSAWAAGLLVLASLPVLRHETRYAKEGFRLFNRRAPETREQAYYESVLTREDHAKEVQLLGLGGWFLDRYQGIFDKLYGEDRQLAIRRSLWGVGAAVLGSGVFYGIYGWIAWEAASGAISVGDMTLYLMAFRQGQSNLLGLVQAASGVVEDRLYLSNLFEFFDAPVRRWDGAAVAGPRPGDGLRLEGVTFVYPGAARAAVDDVTLHVPPGRKLGLVGANGSGKSTLVKLVLGLYRPTGGRVLLDGLDLAAWDLAALRRRQAVVLQDFVRYQLTAGDNVGLGDLPRVADGEAQRDAVLRGLASEVVDALPEGLATRLGKWFKGGTELSGGQWQRVALARAFMRSEADLLVLDEPTSAMDAEAEASLFASLQQAAGDKMAILISHRFSTVRLADHIVVLEHGRVIEEGSHETLMALGGTYARLFSIQAVAYR